MGWKLYDYYGGKRNDNIYTQPIFNIKKWIDYQQKFQVNLQENTFILFQKSLSIDWLITLKIDWFYQINLTWANNLLRYFMRGAHSIIIIIITDQICSKPYQSLTKNKKIKIISRWYQTLGIIYKDDYIMSCHAMPHIKYMMPSNVLLVTLYICYTLIVSLF